MNTVYETSYSIDCPVQVQSNHFLGTHAQGWGEGLAPTYWVICTTNYRAVFLLTSPGCHSSHFQSSLRSPWVLNLSLTHHPFSPPSLFRRPLCYNLHHTSSLLIARLSRSATGSLSPYSENPHFETATLFSRSYLYSGAPSKLESHTCEG